MRVRLIEIFRGMRLKEPREVGLEKNPDDTIRAVLAVSIWITFIASLMTLVLRGIPRGNEPLALQLIITLSSGAALVTNYYFKRRR